MTFYADHIAFISLKVCKNGSYISWQTGIFVFDDVNRHFPGQLIRQFLLPAWMPSL